MNTGVKLTLPPFILDKGEQLYLCVDGGQIPELARQLYGLAGELDLEAIYLFPPYDTLKSVSPYVIRATEPVEQWFLAQNKPLSGYFFASALPLDVICSQMRRLIRIQSPYGSQVFFKLAHSEAAWVLLDTHMPQLWQSMTQAWLPTRDGWRHLRQPEMADTRISPDIRLSDEQWRRLGQISWCNIQKSIARHMMKYFPTRWAELQEPQAWVARWADIAYQKGFCIERDLLMFFNIIGFLGEAALTGAAYPDIRLLVDTPSALPPTQRIEQAAELAFQYSQPKPASAATQQQEESAV
ncbi:DUF4123 domain-containing protein [Shewanella algae]|uniref:DUF4123 domain-containing protein n=1 Tax=Shewanella algae TaxID=38313 RepID=UPI0031F5CC29